MTDSAPCFEKLVNTRVEFGSYHIHQILFLSFIILTDGCEFSTLSLIMPILKKEWNVEQDLQGLLGSMLFIGVLIGSLLNGFLTDKIGRKRTITYVSITQFFLGILSSLISNVYLFIIVRALFGVLLGFVLPLVPGIASEWSPIEKRGKIMTVITAMYNIGQLLSILLASLCLENLGSGNWRILLLLSSFPSLLVFYGCLKFMVESPRYVMLSQDIHAGFDVLNYVIKYNKLNEENLFQTDKDFENFERWREHALKEFIENEKENFFIAKIKEIFNKNYKKITLGLWCSWFGINFTAYGFIFIVPFFLDEVDSDSILSKKSGIIALLIMTLGEAISGFLAYFVIDIPKFGRKNSLQISLFATGSICFILAVITIDNSTIEIFLLTIARFFARVCFVFVYALTSEIYPTLIRTMGLGAASAFGRLSACIMPFILIKFFYIDIYLPFLIISLFSFFAFYGTCQIPYDTTGRYLDVREDLIDHKFNS